MGARLLAGRLSKGIAYTPSLELDQLRWPSLAYNAWLAQAAPREGGLRSDLAARSPRSLPGVRV